MSPSRPDEADPAADFGSHPTDQELVTKYLRRHVDSGGNPWRYVHEADVYAADPDDLTGKYSPAVASDGSRAWYFFTTVRSKSTGGQRRARAVGDGGCWHSEAGAKDVVGGIRSPRPIGRRQFFSFVNKEGPRRVRSGWIMVEIGLKYAQQNASSDELVLCKVYRSPRAPPAAAAANKSMAAPPPTATKSKTEEATPPPDDVKPVVAAAQTPDTKILRAAKEAAAAAATGCKRKADVKSSGARRGKRLCSRCRAETSESNSETAVLDRSPSIEDETADSSEIHGSSDGKFIRFL